MQFYIKQKSERFSNLKEKVRIIIFWSEWRDLNPRPLGPEPSALPTALHPEIFNYITIAMRLFFQRRATNYRSETLSHCSLEAHRIALCFFLLRHCLSPPPAASTPEPLHPEIFNSRLKDYITNRNKNQVFFAEISTYFPHKKK